MSLMLCKLCAGPSSYIVMNMCCDIVCDITGLVYFVSELTVITGGCSGRGVKWIGVVLYTRLVYNIIYITTPCFHYTPLCGM